MSPLYYDLPSRTLLVGLIAGLSAAMFAQTEAPRPAFDVVSVKATPPERLNHLKSERCNGGGAYVTEGTPVLWAIEFADAYDIQGKPAHPVSDQQCRQMVQSLLEQRFHLKLHHETKERPAFFLIVGKNGPKLREVTPDSPKGGIRINGAIQQFLSENEAPSGWSMERIASYLAAGFAVSIPLPLNSPCGTGRTSGPSSSRLCKSSLD